MRILCISAALLCLPVLGHADILGFQYTQLDYPGVQNTLGYGINDSGEITGYYFDPVKTSGGDRGFTYKNGVWTTYQVGSYYSTDLYGVNNAGNLVGSYNSEDFSVVQGIFVPAGGSPQNFSPSTTSQSENYGINNFGQVVGSAFTTMSPSGGYIFDGTTAIPINCPVGSALPHGINDSGAIVGFCEVRT